MAQAVSFARAAQTGQWISAHEQRAAEPAYDAEEIAGLLALIRVHTGAWRRWFGTHRVQPVEVTYEELAADQVGVTLGVLAELGLEPVPGAEIAPPAWLQRQGDELNAEWIARFNA